MMEAASFPHLGRVVNPTAEHYWTEAGLLRLERNEASRGLGLGYGNTSKVNRLHFAMKDYERIARRLAWVPAALQQMKDAA
jgi:hypothetical protein